MEHARNEPVDSTPVTVAAPPAAPPPTPQPPTPRFALWAGIGLVLLGGLLLISQFVPGMELWRWWPLILVALGIRQMFGPRGARWSIRHLGEGLSTVAFGLVLLGQMLGVLRWDVWLNILKLWPVLFISFGLEIIGKATRAEWLRFLGSLVVVAALAYGALVLTPQAGWPPVTRTTGGEEFRHVESHSGLVTEGTADIAGAVGELDVLAGDDLVRAEGSSPYDSTFDVSTRDGQATVEVSAGEGSWMPMTPASALQVALDRDVAWDLTVNAGVSDYELDLSELAVTSLALESGVSNGVLTLGSSEAAGERSPVSVEIDAGVSALVIRVPRGQSVRVVVGEGLSGIESEGEWTRDREGSARIFESDGFSDAGAYWDVHIDPGIGGITLRYY
ncbi:MAG: LiaI-LiaF-like domain-containing protein [Coriobacteriia bacterium]